MTEYYFLDNDDDGHWYLVPHNQRAEWYSWLNFDGEADVPVWARLLSGGPQDVIFIAPKFLENEYV